MQAVFVFGLIYRWRVRKQPASERVGALAFVPLTFLMPVTYALLTPLGLRSLDPANPAYRPYHGGDLRSRDQAYHQGTVWPWLIGPMGDALRRAGLPTRDLLTGLVAHLGDHGLGSVSETANGAAPHRATGCPFQAWSVAETLRNHLTSTDQ